jgi:hypothetical protein
MKVVKQSVVHIKTWLLHRKQQKKCNDRINHSIKFYIEVQVSLLIFFCFYINLLLEENQKNTFIIFETKTLDSL